MGLVIDGTCQVLQALHIYLLFVDLFQQIASFVAFFLAESYNAKNFAAGFRPLFS